MDWHVSEGFLQISLDFVIFLITLIVIEVLMNCFSVFASLSSVYLSSDLKWSRWGTGEESINITFSNMVIRIMLVPHVIKRCLLFDNYWGHAEQCNFSCSLAGAVVRLALNLLQFVKQINRKLWDDRSDSQNVSFQFKLIRRSMWVSVNMFLKYSLLNRPQWYRNVHATGRIQFKVLTILPVTVSSFHLEFKGF